MTIRTTLDTIFDDDQAQAFYEMADNCITSASFDDLVAVWRRALLVTALDQHHGNQCATADALKVHRNTLARWMQELGIDVDGYSRRPPRKDRTDEPSHHAI